MLDVMFIKCCIKVADVSLLPQIEEKGEKVAGNKKRRGEERTREGRKMEAEGK